MLSGCSERVCYTLYPLLAGNVHLPRLSLSMESHSPGHPTSLDPLLTRILPSHIYIMVSVVCTVSQRNRTHANDKRGLYIVSIVTPFVTREIYSRGSVHNQNCQKFPKSAFSDFFPNCGGELLSRCSPASVFYSLVTVHSPTQSPNAHVEHMEALR